MPSDVEQLNAIKTQTLAVIASLTENPKPSYQIDGQRVSWETYLRQLQRTVDWCDARLAGYEPFESQSEGAT